ncbi:MAG: hypothetical protein ABII00_04880 [Elusimicrobiota bacterium]
MRCGPILRELGITHILVSLNWKERYDPRAIRLMTGLLRRLGPPVLREGTYRLFELREKT